MRSMMSEASDDWGLSPGRNLDLPALSGNCMSVIEHGSITRPFAYFAKGKMPKTWFNDALSGPSQI